MCPYHEFSLTPPSHEIVQTALLRIEAEMKNIGLWDIDQPTPEAIANGGAFGTQSMTFEQWLRWVFIPRVHQIIDARGQFPSQSHIADQATREWDMWDSRPETRTLQRLLAEFDALFNT